MKLAATVLAALRCFRSTVKLAKGKLAGTLTNAEKDRPFEISLDVPVLTGGTSEAVTSLPPSAARSASSAARA